MLVPRLRHNRYVDASGSVRPHDGRHHAEDLKDLHLPLARLQQAAVREAGVVRGFGVRGVPGAAEVVVESGVAVDPVGRLVVLGADGRGDVGAHPAGGEHDERPVPVAVPLVGPAGVYYLTAQFNELLRIDEGAGGRLEQAPWLRLVPVAGSVLDPAAVVLAVVEVEVAGPGQVPRLAGLDAGHGRAVSGRRVAGPTVGELVLAAGAVRAGEAPQEVVVGERVAGRLTARPEGGLGLSVAAAADVVTLADAEGGRFARLDIQAEQVVTGAGLQVGGAARFGAATVDGPLQVSGPATVGGALAAAELSSAGRLAVSGPATVGGPLSAPELSTTGPATVGGALTVTGPTSTGPFTVTGPAGVRGALTVTGRIQVGHDAVAGMVLDPGETSPHAAHVRFGDNTGWQLHLGRSREQPGGPLNTGLTGVLVTLQDGGDLGVGTPGPLGRLHARAAGGFTPEDADGVLRMPSRVPLLAQSDSTAFGILNAHGRPAFALNIDGNAGTTSQRGVPTFYDRYDGSWHAGLSLRNGDVGVGTAMPVNRLDVSGDVALHGRHALRGNDGWLRLNQDRAFPAGTHTPGLFAPVSLNVGGVGGWGNPGDGNVQVAGALACNGLSPHNNAPGDTDGAGFPSWSGRGVNVWDLMARGGIFIGSNIENPQIQMYADGTLRARDKRFCIDHPLDPCGHLLVHACLEGPESAVYYRGESRLEDGHAVVELPGYFEALTRPAGRTVSVTPCCEEEAVSALAASRVTGGRFRVRAIDDRNPRQQFFWEVKAVRCDVEQVQVEVPRGGATRPSG